MSQFLANVGPFAPLVVFALAAAESAAFVGLAVPGELAVILGGVVAGTGGASLAQVMVAAVFGAIVGDSVGYWLGSRTGPALLARPRMAKLSTRLTAASRLIGERGWWALVVARFAAVLRAVVPFSAGMGKMPYPRFLVGNVIGGVAWGVGFTLVGYLAGANYPVVERWIRLGGLAVVAVLATLTAIVLGTRWARSNRTAIVERADKALRRAPLKWVTAGVERSNRPPAVLAWVFAALVGGLWLFGGLMQDVIGSEEFFLLDRAILVYLDTHRVPVLIDIARLVDSITRPVWVLSALAAYSIWSVIRKHHRLAVSLVVAAAGQWGIVELTRRLVGRAAPAVTPLVPRADYGFPSVQVALVVALIVVAAWPWDRPGWRPTVTRFGAAAVIAALASIAQVILLIDYPSDTLAAVAVAAAWSLVVCLIADRRDGRAVPAASRIDIGLQDDR